MKLRTLLVIMLIQSNLASGIEIKQIRVGGGIEQSYLNPLFSFSGTETDFTKRQLGYRPEFFVRHLSAYVGYKNYLLEYTQYYSYALCAYAYISNSSSFLPYGISLNQSSEISTIVEFKRHSIIFSKLFNERDHQFEFGAGLAIGNTSKRSNGSYNDTIKYPAGNMVVSYTQNVKSPISLQVGLRLGIQRKFIFPSLYIFGNLTYYQGFLKSENVTETFTFKNTSVYFNAISRSSTVGGTIGLRYMLNFNLFKKKSTN